jgi:hypothetical protein
MKALKNENLKQLTEKVYDLISVTVIQFQLRNVKAEDMVVLAKYFAKDLMTENSFKCLTFNQIQEAFHIGIRNAGDKKFIDIPTFYKWVKTHKQRINEAEYKVSTLKQDPKQVPYYQKPIRLLK